MASLYRAVARAEQILYTYHLDAIQELTGVPADVDSQASTVGSTKENLEKSSNETEADQLDTDYATYVKAARAEGNRNAAKVLEYARIVEAQNVRLFAAAARNFGTNAQWSEGILHLRRLGLRRDLAGCVELRGT